jgi:hypothetical protein
MTHRARFSALLLPFALLAFIPNHPLEVVMSPAEEQLRALLATYETSLNASNVGGINFSLEDSLYAPIRSDPRIQAIIERLKVR